MRRLPVRLLHARFHPHDPPIAGRNARSHRRRHPPLPFGQPLPLRRLSRDHRGGQAGRSQAPGLEAGKTKIKFKDVQVGTIQDIQLDKNLSGVVVTAEMVKQSEQFHSENSRFWVDLPRLSARGISGLGTLVSGAFIEVDPGNKGKKTKRICWIGKTAGDQNRYAGQ